MSVTTDRRLLPFLLTRPENGVVVIEATDPETGSKWKYLSDREPWLGQTYDPREEAPFLLHEFTQLPAGAEEYARFASKWGLLGLARLFPAEGPAKPGSEPEWKEPIPGESGTSPLESPADWERTVLELKTVGALHGALVNDDRAALLRVVEVRDGWLEFGDMLHGYDWKYVEEMDNPAQMVGLDQLHDFSSFATIPLSLVASAEYIDEDLEGAAWELLAWSINTRTQNLIGYGLCAPDPAQPELLELRLSPKGQLCAWLWLQLAETVARGKPMQMCSRCDQWYFQNPEGRRQHGIYCSTRCRVAAWRSRQAGRQERQGTAWGRGSTCDSR